MCGYFIHYYAAIFLHDCFNCCNGLWFHYLVCLTGRGESVTELMSFMDFLLHSYTCCSDRHVSPYPKLSFVDEFRWVSPLHHLKNGWQKAILLCCMLQAGGPLSLHYYCAIVLRSCFVLPPVGHSLNHEFIVVNLQDNRAMFRTFITLSRFSFESPS